MKKLNRQPKNEQRKRIFAKRDEIMELVRAGFSGKEIRTEVGLTDVPLRTFYYSLDALKREAKISLASVALGAVMRGSKTRKPAPEKKAEKAPTGAKPSAEKEAPTGAKKPRRKLKVTQLGKGAKDAPSLDPKEWGKKK